MKRLLALTCCIVMMLIMLPLGAWAADYGPYYYDENGSIKFSPSSSSYVTSSTTVMTSGWWIVSEVINVSSIRVSGNVNLVLAGGQLIANATDTDLPGIQVESGSSLTVYSGFYTNPNFLIRATGGRNCAGIGGAYGKVCGDIIICSGYVYAYGGKNHGLGTTTGAGIGSGGDVNSFINGSVIVRNGHVFAQGHILTENPLNESYMSGPGIGGNNCTVTIYNGEVNAVGGPYGAGIGCGILNSNHEYTPTGGSVYILGGTVTATGGASGAGIGSSFYGKSGNISINDGTVTAVGGAYSAGIGNGYHGVDFPQISIAGGVVSAQGKDGMAGIGGELTTVDNYTPLTTKKMPSSKQITLILQQQ